MNQHYAFWVDYYAELEKKGILTKEGTKKKNDAIVSNKWTDSDHMLPFQKETEGFQSFCLRTAYPGLTTGIGLTHSVGKNYAEVTGISDIQLGFSFDYVTGLPVIPGSSVKGVLRSAFLWETEYTLAALKDVTGQSFSEKQLKLLELLIFGDFHGEDKEGRKRLNEKELEKLTTGKNVFFDAFPVKAGKNDQLIGLDYITPHISDDRRYRGLTEPNPNAFLKVLPGVTFQFRFRLTDSEVDGIIISADMKKELFKRLLTDFGAGAKTNVGYGYMDEATEQIEGTYLVCQRRAQPAGTRPAPQRRPVPTASVKVSSVTEKTQIKAGMFLRGTVTRTTHFGAFVSLIPSKRVDGLVHVSKISKDYVASVEDYLAVGQEVMVKVLGVDDKGRISLSMKDVPS